jgi:hypothetical protein
MPWFELAKPPSWRSWLRNNRFSLSELWLQLRLLIMQRNSDGDFANRSADANTNRRTYCRAGF